jgi:class 3 adenylate cyclase
MSHQLEEVLTNALLLAYPKATEELVDNRHFISENHLTPELKSLLDALNLFHSKDYEGSVSLLSSYQRRLNQDYKPSFSVHAGILLSQALNRLSKWNEALSVLQSIQSNNDEQSAIELLAISWRMGDSYRSMHHYSEAMKHYSRAHSIAVSNGLPLTANSICIDMAAAILGTGDTARAIAMYQQVLVSLSSFDALEVDSISVKARINLASVYLSVGRLSDATHEFEALANNMVVLRDINLKLSVQINLAISYKRSGRTEESILAYQRAWELATTEGDSEFEVRALIGLADHFVKSKDLTRAREYATQAFNIAREKNVATLFNETLIHVAAVDREEGKRVEAIEGMQSSFNSMIEVSDDNNAIIYGTELAAWMAEDDRFAEAYEIQKKCNAIQKAIYEKDIERTIELAAVRTQLDLERETIRNRDEERTKILLSVLPQHIANRLMIGETHIADRLPEVTIMFADIVGFTAIASVKEPEELVELLENLFSVFDEISAQFGCERIKTIGDSYMSCCGASEPFVDHTERICRAALAMLDPSTKLPVDSSLLRIGINSGPVVAGVMSGSRLSYDVWGDTVNVAARMEEHSQPGRIHCSSQVASIVMPVSAFNLEKREPLDIRGKGLMTTYWLTKS